MKNIMTIPRRMLTTAFLLSAMAILAGVAGFGQSLPDSGLNSAGLRERCSPASTDPVNAGVCAHNPVRILPWRDAGAAVGSAFPAPAGAHLTYFGGPVISSVNVVEVAYGSGSYLPQLTSGTAPNVPGFYRDITNSAFLDLLSEYNTVGLASPGQTIGRGNSVGLFTITPSAANNGTVIDDIQIQSELQAQISAGHLPAPILDAGGNATTVYMVHFPHGKTIRQGGSLSCQASGFCAYHGTVRGSLTRPFLYGVLPDMQSGSGCDTGCGNSSVFNNYTAVASHELAETITDPLVGLVVTTGPPLAWYDINYGEIGDICNAIQAPFTVNGIQYTIQALYSNRSGACITPQSIVPSATGLSVTLNPVLRRQFTQFTAHVSPGTPTGTISFFDGTTLIGTNTLDSTGTARLSVFFTTLGIHTITARYGGDTFHTPSTSPGVDEEVDIRISTGCF